jgi:GDPmannose 4,6-dehydratase
LINPSSSYGITKALGLELCRLYRSRHGTFAAAGILYNHESILRADSFISKKIINGVVEIKLDKRKMLVLGDLKAVIDWGYAPDYVRAMQLILKNKIPNDFIIATGRRHTVLDFVKAVFGYLKLDWKQHVVVDVRVVHKSRFYRIGNPAFLKKKTGWKPSVNFKEMVNLLLKQKLNISA